jgi:hypothetical protein
MSHNGVCGVLLGSGEVLPPGSVQFPLWLLGQSHKLGLPGCLQAHLYSLPQLDNHHGTTARR